MSPITPDRIADGSSPEKGSRIATSLLGVTMAAFIAFFGWLAIMRHATFQSSAMDLGYTDQALWNTLRGRWLRFSTYENAPIDLPLKAFRRTDILLAYHVEPLLIPLALLYLVYDSPVVLLLFQVVGVALGALPAFWLARDHLHSAWAGLVFGVVYLLAPAIEGAVLSDFHTVSLASTLFLYAFYLVRRGTWWLYFAAVVLLLSVREDVSLLVLTWGLYLVLWQRTRLVGLVTAGLGLLWFLICSRFILPHFSGLGVTPFLERLAVFGPTFDESWASLRRDPSLALTWLLRPEIMRYLGGLLASVGFLALLSPVTLLPSVPILAINTFSTWSWTYSEGEHYSVSIFGFLILSAIYGVAFLSRHVHRRAGIRERWVVYALCALVLSVSSYHHYHVGLSPMARHYQAPRMTAHHRLASGIMKLIPPDAAVSAQANLYPHISHREKAYLFPAVNDADYVLLDVISPSYPVSVAELYRSAFGLLHSGDYGVMVAQDGYLLLKRGAFDTLGVDLDDGFYSFARASSEEVHYPLSARFGGKMDLLGYDYDLLNVINAQQIPVIVRTYWRVAEAVPLDYAPALYFTRQDGAIVAHHADGTATSLWYPTSMWQPGEIVSFQTPILMVGRLRDAMVSVLPPGKDPWVVADRLQPIVVADDTPREVFQESSLLRLFGFP